MIPLKNIRKFLSFSLLLLLFILGSVETLMAQMFSVRNEERRIRPATNVLSIGTGPLSFDSFSDVVYTPSYNADGYMLYAQFDTPSIDLYLGFAGESSGTDSVRVLNFGVELNRILPVSRNPKALLGIPVQISTDLTTARNNRYVGPADQFQQSTLIAATGFSGSFRFGERFRLRTTPTGEYGFTFSPGNTFIGQAYGIDWKSRFIIDELIGKYGLSVGYDFQFRRFDVDADRYDYDFLSHRLLIGLAF